MDFFPTGNECNVTFAIDPEVHCIAKILFLFGQLSF